ncbi:IS66 family insertion sequence element accessory protein TnpB [Bradyrhizobium sp. 174]|uniref:IS66 family insertion sequence element accessory protein TnpB n=1 Tax=Bradyrhizobium sp. 174 TaxID=2782645 RepID=UPI002098541A|nr:IS66 family insertion sequence element accessory protein TnpB [Bradyrhizobium sp. 174]
MIAPGADLKIYIATRPAKVQEMLRLDPFSGAAFVFRSKRADRIKILVWDRTGLGIALQAPRRLQIRLVNDCGRRDAHVAGDVRRLVRGAGLEVGPPGRSAATAGAAQWGWDHPDGESIESGRADWSQPERSARSIPGRHVPAELE